MTKYIETQQVSFQQMILITLSPAFARPQQKILQLPSTNTINFPQLTEEEIRDTVNLKIKRMV